MSGAIERALQEHPEEAKTLETYYDTEEHQLIVLKERDGTYRLLTERITRVALSALVVNVLRKKDCRVRVIEE